MLLAGNVRSLLWSRARVLPSARPSPPHRGERLGPIWGKPKLHRIGERHIDHADGKAGQIGRDRIAAVALSTELARSFRAKGVYGRLILANGGRISLLSARSDGQTLVGRTVSGSTVQVPINVCGNAVAILGFADANCG